MFAQQTLLCFHFHLFTLLGMYLQWAQFYSCEDCTLLHNYPSNIDHIFKLLLTKNLWL